MEENMNMEVVETPTTYYEQETASTSQSSNSGIGVGGVCGLLTVGAIAGQFVLKGFRKVKEVYGTYKAVKDIEAQKAKEAAEAAQKEKKVDYYVYPTVEENK